MATNKCTFALSLIIILGALLTTLCMLESTKKLHTIIGELKYIIPIVFQGFLPSGNNQKSTSVVGPNLTSCHPSYGRSDLLVNCCPPTDESLDPIVDFQFPDPSSPLRVRKPLHLLDADYIAKYEKAVSIMKSLPHSDPRSLSRQANLHCLYCTGAYDQQHYSDFPLNIHSSWFFYPWHRMFLHFHERILGSLIGDDTFALPFWPWDIPEGYLFPDMFLNDSFVDKDRDRSHFPPKIIDLNFLGSESGLSPEEQIKTNMALMYTQMVSGAKKTELFMGCPCTAGKKGYCHGHGTVEWAPHDTVHYWVGSSSNPQRENMGVFYAAARDPIFYPHHCNIDRLWEVRRMLFKTEAISDPHWLDSYFIFHDEKRQLVRIKIRDVLDTTKLRYVYHEVDMPWINARPKPSVPPKAARPILKLKESQNVLQISSNSHLLSSDFRPFGQALGTSLTIKVVRPKINRTKKEKEEEEEVLVVYGIHLKDDIYAKFDVYINAVDETIISPKFREFAGTFVHMPRGVRFIGERNEIMRQHQTLKLGLSELLEDLEADGDESIWVTLLPRTKSCGNITVDGIKIEYLR